MANITQQKVITGNILNLLIGGQNIGVAQSADARTSYGTEGVWGIGQFMPQEYVQLKYDGSLTIDRFFIRNQDLRSLGLLALGDDILQLGVIDIEVVDTVTLKQVRVFHSCTVQDWTNTFRANAICGENSTWRYLDVTPTLSDPPEGPSAG